MHRLAALGLALALSACADKSGNSDTVHVRYLTDLPQHSAEQIDDAADLLGMEIVVDEPVAPIGSAVLVFKTGRNYNGHGGITEWTDWPPCGPVSWVDDSWLLLAHELGHALGLDHVDDPNNLMSGGHILGTGLTDEQLETMRATAWHLQHKC